MIEKDHSMIQTCRLKNVVIFIQIMKEPFNKNLIMSEEEEQF